MKNLSSFRPRVAARVPGCSDPLIDQAVLDTCIDFCERTLVVKRTLDSFLTVAGTASYDVPVGLQQSVAHIMRVWCGTSELRPLDEDGIATPYGFVSSVPGDQTPSGTPSYYNETDPGVLQLYPRPDGAHTINVRAAMRPLRTATQVEDQLFEDWVEAITDGALTRLYMVPGDFANAPLAKFHAAAYQGGVDRAMLQASKGRTRAESRVTPVHI